MKEKINKRPTTILILILTLAIIGVMLYSSFLGRSMAERFVPLVDAAMEIKLEATTAHLWFEEIIGGDRYADIKEVWQHLDQAQWYAQAMLEGGENPEGKFVALEDPALRHGIEQTLAGIEAFRAIAQERWKTQAHSGIGSDIDQRFDKTFNDFLVAADEVETALQRAIAGRLQRFQLVQGLLVAIALILGALSAIVLRRHERRRTGDMLILQDREENLRTTLHSISDAVIATDTSGAITRMNPVAERLTGWAFEESQGKPLIEVFRIVNARTKEPAFNPVERVLNSGKIVGLANHTALIAKDGTQYHIADSAAPIRDGEGVVTGVVLVFRDITDEYAARAALEESEGRWQFALQGSRDGVWDWNTATNEVFYSERWKEMLGYEEEDMSNGLDEWDKRVHPDDKARCYTDLNKHFNGETPFYENEHRLLCKDGSYKWILDRGKVISWTEEHKPLRIIGTHTDITERKQAEAEQSRLQSELQQAHKMEALGQLTGGIAHDFNNILGIMLGYTELAVSRGAHSGQAQLLGYLKHVEKAGGRAKELVAQMLAYSRSETRDDKPLQLQPLVKEDLKMLRATLPTGIEIQTKIEEELPDVLMDPTQLNQLLMNLCTNARDAMKGQGTLIIRLGWARGLDTECAACRQQIEGDWIELSVTDTGSGIKPEVLERIFDPFYTTKDVGKGTGMGLSVLHGIVRSHGGHILVATQPGKGTGFRLLFPPVVVEPPDAPEPAPSSEELPQGHGEQVLILDDEPDLGRFLGDLLDSFGYHATVLTNSQEALERFKENPGKFDLLITDQTMPGMSGVELVKTLRITRPELPVILNTGFSEDIDAESAVTLGIRYLEKPVRSQRLLQAVRDLLRPA